MDQRPVTTCQKCVGGAMLIVLFGEVLPKVNKVIADEKLGQNFMPFLPINELRRAANTDSGARQSTTMR